MRQEIRRLRRMFGIIVVLLVVYAGLLYYDAGSEAEVIVEQVVPVMTLRPADIRAVALKNDSGAFGLLAAGDGRVTLVPEDPAVQYSLQEMQGFLYLVSHMSSLRVLSAITDLAAFGLDKPVATLTLIQDDGSKSRYLLGKVSDANGSRYLLREGEKRIFVIPEKAAKLLLRSRADFVQRELIPSLEVKDIEKVQEVSVSARSRPARGYTVKNTGGYHFSLQKPIRNILSTERFFSEIILPLTVLYPQRLAEIKDDPFAEGSDYMLELILSGQKYRILAVRKNEDMFYIKDAAKPEVFEIPAERIAFLNLDYLELLHGAIYNCNVSSIDSLIFEDIVPDKTYTLYISGAGDKLQGEIEGRVVSYRELMTFINMLNSIAMVEEVVQLPGSLPAAYASITLNKKDGSRDFLEFIRAGKGENFLRVNGEINFKVLATVAGKIGDSLQRIIAGEKIQQQE